MKPALLLTLAVLGTIVYAILSSTDASWSERIVWAVMWCGLAWLLVEVVGWRAAWVGRSRASRP